jgi:hypothetical protein
MTCHRARSVAPPAGLRRVAALGLALALVAGADPARAFDPATTHAGLTERAVMASSLHRVLSRRLGRPLGLLEPLQIHSRTFEPGARRALWARFEALDPAGGYRPGADGVAGALAWVVAGSVLAQTPPERGRNHFLDPRRRAGLDDRPGLTGVAHQLRLTLDDGTTVRDLATGRTFDLTGQSSLEWIASARNDQGLPVLLANLDRAVSADEPAERESALVRALMALGGIMSALEDAGEPAHVRNDFRTAFLHRQGPSSWDCSSTFERFVAGRYGRLGVPAPRTPVRRPTLESYFTAADGQGLADRTQRRFFSEGTLPEDVPIDLSTSTRDVVLAARESLAYPEPGIEGLSLKEMSAPHYMIVDGRRVLGYVREPGHVRFFLDGAVYADAAKALLPEVAAYTAGLLDHLLRAGLALTAAGSQVTINLEGVATPRDATLHVYVEDDGGRRRELPGPVAVETLVAGHPLEITAPAGARRVAAVLRGQDAGGSFVAVGETAIE